MTRRAGWLAAIVVLAGAGVGCTQASGDPQERKPHVRVTVAGGCPHSLGQAQDVRNSASGLKHSLVPKGASPSAALVCAFGPQVAAGQRVVRLDAAQARRLHDALAQVSLKQPHGKFSCPAAFAGAVTVMAIGYAARDDVDLWYRTSGCRTIDNGQASAFQGANPSFYNGFENVLQDLTGAS